MSLTPPPTPEEQLAQLPHGEASYEAPHRPELPREEPTHAAALTARVAPLLMLQEQRIVSLAIALPRSEEREQPLVLRSAGDTPSPRPPLPRRAIFQLGAGIEVLADGTVVATMPPRRVPWIRRSWRCAVG